MTRTWRVRGLLVAMIGAVTVAFLAAALADDKPKPKVPAPDFSKLQSVKVVRVIDGDTIEVEGGEKVRLVGVDTPETVHPSKPVERYGKEASDCTRRRFRARRSSSSPTATTPAPSTATATAGYSPTSGASATSWTSAPSWASRGTPSRT